MKKSFIIYIGKMKKCYIFIVLLFFLFGCELAYVYHLKKAQFVEREFLTQNYRYYHNSGIEIISYMNFTHFDLNIHFSIKNNTGSMVKLYYHDIELKNKSNRSLKNYKLYNGDNFLKNRILENKYLEIKMDSMVNLFYVYENVTDSIDMGSPFPFIKDMSDEMKGLKFSFNKFLLNGRVNKINLQYGLKE